jgi:hypothetical protein
MGPWRLCIEDALLRERGVGVGAAGMAALACEGIASRRSVEPVWPVMSVARL